MNIEGKIIKLDSAIRNYVNFILEQQTELVNENNMLKKKINKLQSDINTLKQTIHSIELALLGNKNIYEELLQDYNKSEKINNSDEENDEFLHLSNKQQLKKIRENNN